MGIFRSNAAARSEYLARIEAENRDLRFKLRRVRALADLPDDDRFPMYDLTPFPRTFTREQILAALEDD